MHQPIILSNRHLTLRKRKDAAQRAMVTKQQRLIAPLRRIEWYRRRGRLLMHG